MKAKVIVAGLLAATLPTMVANACIIYVTVSCPDNGNAVAGIKVCATGKNLGEIEYAFTDSSGLATLSFANPDIYNVCLCDTSALPPGTSVVGGNDSCQLGDVSNGGDTSLTFDLQGDLCSPPPTTSKCWETGGGTLDKARGKPLWTFGGVIYPGCSPTAAGGGNLNIVNHVTGLHFKGTNFVVDDCRGVATRSPKVTVNIIDWHGFGYVSGDDESKKTPVTFVGTFRDAKESGAAADGLYIQVKDGGGNLVFQIGGGPNDLDLLTTGNVQIHQSSCGK
jgi:hypothetical protein